MNRLTIIDRLADEAVTVVAIGALAAVCLTGHTDPTTTVIAISGLGGYRIRQKAKSPPTDATAQGGEN